MKRIAIIDRGRGPQLAHSRITVFDVLHYMEAGHAARGGGRDRERIAEHREGLELLIKVSEAVLGSHPVGAPERGRMGFTLAFFAGELASVLAFGELGSASVDAPLRRACLESIAAASLNAAGCLVGGEWVRPPGRRY